MAEQHFEQGNLFKIEPSPDFDLCIMQPPHSEESYSFLETLVELCSFSRRWSVLHMPNDNAFKLRKNVLPAEGLEIEYQETLYWARTAAEQSESPPRSTESLLLMHNRGTGSHPETYWSGPDTFTHFGCLPMRGADRHPEQMPLDLALSLVSWFSEPDDWVVDYCCGWGTVGIACALLDRNFVGYDLDKSNIAQCKFRIDKLSQQDAYRSLWWLNDGDKYENGSQDYGARRRKEDRDRVRSALPVIRLPGQQK